MLYFLEPVFPKPSMSHLLIGHPPPSKCSTQNILGVILGLSPPSHAHVQPLGQSAHSTFKMDPESDCFSPPLIPPWSSTVISQLDYCSCFLASSLAPNSLFPSHSQRDSLSSHGLNGTA